MGSKVFGVLQRVGRSFMLPIALLPIAGLLLGLGASLTNGAFVGTYHLENVLGPGTPLNAVLTVMQKSGDVVFGNLPLLFAMGIALGMAKKEKEVATLSAAVGYLVMHASTAAMVAITQNNALASAGAGASLVTDKDGNILVMFGDQVLKTVFRGGQLGGVCGLTSLQSGVFGGIIVGLGVAALHNKFYKFEAPNALSFFGGTRFVPIITAVTYIIVGVIMFIVWPVVQMGLSAAGTAIGNAGLVGTFLFGFVKRALIPFGLHHVWYTPFWYTELGGVYPVLEHFKDLNALHAANAVLVAEPGQVVQSVGRAFNSYVGSVNVAGGQRAFFAELGNMDLIQHFNTKATRFFTGEYFFMMFGFPGGALAMYHTAKPERKKVVGGLLLGAALTSFFTGITEPIEFSFLFAAPVLFGVHLIFGGLAYVIAEALHISIGVSFSAGFIDLLMFGVLPGNARTGWLLVPVIGVIYFIIYYFSFKFLILKFNFKTPGREDEDEETKLYTKADVQAKNAAAKGSGADTELSRTITLGLGGKANISDVDACATRLRVTVKKPELVKEAVLKSTGASGVIFKGNGVQIIFGPRVSIVKSNLEDFLDSPDADSLSADAEIAPTAANTGNAVKSAGTEIIIASPLEGKVIPLSKVEDVGFAEEMLGKGAAVIPTKGIVKAPFNGTILDTSNPHAVCMVSDDGIELIVHVGIDTVKLNGKGFSQKFKKNQKFKKGDVLSEFDAELITKAGYPITTPIIVTNTDDYAEVAAVTGGNVTFGDKIITVK